MVMVSMVHIPLSLTPTRCPSPSSSLPDRPQLGLCTPLHRVNLLVHMLRLQVSHPGVRAVSVC